MRVSESERKGEMAHLLDVVPRPDVYDDIFEVAQLSGDVERLCEWDERGCSCINGERLSVSGQCDSCACAKTGRKIPLFWELIAWRLSWQALNLAWAWRSCWNELERWVNSCGEIRRWWW